MKKGEISPLMWIVLGVIVMLAVMIVIMKVNGVGFSALGGIKGALP